MNKLLTIGLAAAALAGGIAATSSAAQAADWNHGGYQDHGRNDGGYQGSSRGDRDRGRGDHERGDRGRGGYRYGGCHSYRTWKPYWGRYTTVTRCY